MPITQLELENFKSLERASLELGKITVIIGPNGTGKSSFLQALGLLKQSRQQTSFVWNGLEVKSGGFADIVSFGATKRQIRFGLTIEAPSPQFLSNKNEKSNYTCKYIFTIDNFGPFGKKLNITYQVRLSVVPLILRPIEAVSFQTSSAME